MVLRHWIGCATVAAYQFRINKFPLTRPHVYLLVQSQYNIQDTVGQDS